MIALALGLFAALCWSLHDLIARRFASNLGPYRMTILVMLAGLVLFAPLIAQSPGFTMATGRDWALMLLLGIVYAIAVSSLFKGFSMAPVSVVGPFTAGYPALVVLWGLVNGLAPTAWQYLSMVAIIMGAVIVGRFGADDGGVHSIEKGKLPLVILFSVLASVAFAVDVVLGQHLSKTFGEVPTAGMLRLPAALCLLPIAWPEKSQAGAYSKWAVAAIIAMAVFDVVALSGINYMAKFPGKELGAMGISAYGGIATLLAMLILKEKVAPMQWLGIGAIVAGVAVLGVSAA